MKNKIRLIWILVIAGLFFNSCINSVAEGETNKSTEPNPDDDKTIIDVAGGSSETESVGKAYVVIEAFDAPPKAEKDTTKTPEEIVDPIKQPDVIPGNTDTTQATKEKLSIGVKSLTLDKVLLHITEVRMQKLDTSLSADTSDTSQTGWITVAKPDSIIDFLLLIGGKTSVLGKMEIPAVKYSRMKLVLGSNNSLVVGGESHLLTVPSGSESGIKLKLSTSTSDDTLALAHGDTNKIFLDFDISKSIKLAGDKYLFTPSFTVFNGKKAGKISGQIALPQSGYRIEVESGRHTAATLPDADGKFTLLLPYGNYRVVLLNGEGVIVKELQNQKISGDVPELKLEF